MNNKLLIGTIFLVIILCGFGFYFYTLSGDSEVITIGSTTFSMPEGYEKGVQNADFDVNLTNGKNIVYIKDIGNKSIADNIGKYTNELNESKYRYNITNFTVDNIVVFKSNINGSNVNHFWFVQNGDSYIVHSWDNNTKIDKIVADLIKSSRHS